MYIYIYSYVVTVGDLDRPAPRRQPHLPEDSWHIDMYAGCCQYYL